MKHVNTTVAPSVPKTIKQKSPTFNQLVRSRLVKKESLLDGLKYQALLSAFEKYGSDRSVRFISMNEWLESMPGIDLRNEAVAFCFQADIGDLMEPGRFEAKYGLFNRFPFGKEYTHYQCLVSELGELYFYYIVILLCRMLPTLGLQFSKLSDYAESQLNLNQYGYNH